MSMPSASDAVWQKLVSGQINFQLENLAVKVFLGSAKLQLSRDSSPNTLRRLAGELREVFVRNESLQSVKNDLAKISK